MLRMILRCVLLAIPGLYATQSSAADYHFVNIADTSGAFEGFEFFPQSVSDSGEVAFIGVQGGVPGSYIGDGSTTVNVAPDLSPPEGFRQLGRYALNQSGVTASKVGSNFSPRQQKIQLFEGAGVQVIAEIESAEPVAKFFSAPAINNHGDVLFAIGADNVVEKAPGVDEISIALWSDETLTTIVDVEEGFELLGALGVNDSGGVAFQGTKDQNFEDWQYYFIDDGVLTTIADSAGPLNIKQELEQAAVNDSGAVAFWSPLDDGSHGIFVGDGGPLETVALANPSTPFFELSTTMSINEQGAVAYAARFWDGRTGILTGGDPVEDLVVAHGDFLFGSPVIGLGRPYLNDRGDLAFFYTVGDLREPDGERDGIALAIRQPLLEGDYNADGVVDAADYTVWRDSLGSTTQLAADGDGSGTVDAADYGVWKDNFGMTASTLTDLSHTAVPEPRSLVLLLAACWVLCRHRSKAPQ